MPIPSTLQGRATLISTKTVHPVDEVIKPGPMITLALQHLIAMYAGAVSIPLLIGGMLRLSAADTRYLVSSDLFACGLATLVQVLGIGPIGVRLPVIMGVTFVGVMPAIAIAMNPSLGLPAVYGGCIAAGVLLFPLTIFADLLARVLTPVVTGSTMLLIGLSILGPTAEYAAGGRSATDYGAAHCWALAGFTIAVILLVTRYGSSKISSYAILIGMASGYLAAFAFGYVDFEALTSAPVIATVEPFHFGRPTFELQPVISMIAVLLVTFVESSGMLKLLGGMVDRPVTKKQLAAGLRADCVGTALGGIFNSFPYTSYAQNIALVGTTGVKSRFVCAVAAGMMLLLAFLPKTSGLVASMPHPVLGGAGLVMGGFIIVSGVRALSLADFTNSRANVITAAVSISVGLIPIMARDSLSKLPHTIQTLANSGVIVAILTAVTLNLFFHGLHSTDVSTRETAH